MKKRNQMIIRIPFGQGFEECEVENRRVKALLEPLWPAPAQNQEARVLEALSNPIESKGLKELASGVRQVLIITSDNTRPVPSKITMPQLLNEIRRAAPSASVHVLIATGLHEWNPSKSELEDKFGSSLDDVEEVFVHKAKDEDSLVDFGELSTGNRLYVDKLLEKVDLLVAEGFIEGHFFAGFTGGPKSILPGVSGVDTIMINHSPRNIDHPNARCGMADGNPIYEEMCEAARRARLQFVLNVVLDKNKRIVAAFAGDVIQAHGRGRSFSLSCCRVYPVLGDIVITSNGGYPLDRNLYQLVKGISNGALTAKEGGVIIACGECRDGVGHQGFYDMLASSSSPSEFLKRLRAGEIWREAQWEAQILAKVLEKFKVVVVSKGVNAKIVESMHMIHASNLKEAIEVALNFKPNGGITLLPDGPSAIPLT